MNSSSTPATTTLAQRLAPRPDNRPAWVRRAEANRLPAKEVSR